MLVSSKCQTALCERILLKSGKPRTNMLTNCSTHCNLHCPWIPCTEDKGYNIKHYLIIKEFLQLFYRGTQTEISGPYILHEDIIESSQAHQGTVWDVLIWLLTTDSSFIWSLNHKEDYTVQSLQGCNFIHSTCHWTSWNSSTVQNLRTWCYKLQTNVTLCLFNATNSCLKVQTVAEISISW